MNCLLRTAAIVLVSLLVPVAGHARGSITGQVKDASGKAVAGVRVEASTDNHSSGAHAMHLMQMALHGQGVHHAERVETRRSAVTDLQGKYKVTDLGPGKFNVQYTAPRLRTLRREGVAVSNNQVVPVNVVMERTTVAQTKAQASLQVDVLATVQDHTAPSLTGAKLQEMRSNPSTSVFSPAGRYSLWNHFSEWSPVRTMFRRRQHSRFHPSAAR